MPIYEYLCKSCGHEFEILQGFRESPLTDCPACLESQLQKKLSAAAFHLKGTGWYETDFKNSGKPAADKSSDSESDAKSSSEKSKSDSDKSESAKKPAAASKQSSSTAPAN